jgi:hypothetical protein
MGRRTTLTVGPLTAASANAVALSQSLGGAGNVTLNGALVVGGVAVLDQPRRIIVTSAGNDSGITFTAYGTDWSDQAIQSKATAGGNIAAVDLGVSFKTVTRIAASGATAAAITVGTNGIADSRPLVTDEFSFGPATAVLEITGTANATVRLSQDDPNGEGGFGVPLGVQNMVWVDDAVLKTLAVTTAGSWTAVPKTLQLTLNSGTGSAKLVFTQHAGPWHG